MCQFLVSSISFYFFYYHQLRFLVCPSSNQHRINEDDEERDARRPEYRINIRVIDSIGFEEECNRSIRFRKYIRERKIEREKEELNIYKIFIKYL